MNFDFVGKIDTPYFNAHPDRFYAAQKTSELIPIISSAYRNNRQVFDIHGSTPPALTITDIGGPNGGMWDVDYQWLTTPGEERRKFTHRKGLEIDVSKRSFLDHNKDGKIDDQDDNVKRFRAIVGFMGGDPQDHGDHFHV